MSSVTSTLPLDDASSTASTSARNWSLVRVLATTRLKTWTRNRCLGFWWWLLEPLAMTGVYIALVQLAFRANTPHVALFVMCAVLPWSWFTVATNDAMMSLKRNRGRLLSFQVNAALFPLGDVLATLVRYVASMLVFVALVLYYQLPITSALLWLVPLVFVQFLLAAGFSWWLCVIQVYLEDTANLWRLWTRAWFFLAPSIYALDQIPSRVAVWLWFNPFTTIFDGYRAIWIRGAAPQLLPLLVTATMALFFAIAGYRFARVSQQRLALSL